MRKELVANILLLAFVGIICMIVLELLFIGFSPQKTTAYREQVVLPIYEKGAALPLEVQPWLALEDVHDHYREYVTTIHTDQFGFRRRNTDPGKSTILVLGDSQTFGHGSSDSEVWPNRLDSIFDDCQIINAGIPGGDPNYYRALLEAILSGEFTATHGSNTTFSDVRQIIIGLNAPGNDWFVMAGAGDDPSLTSYQRFKIEDGKLVMPGKPNLFSRVDRVLGNLQAYCFFRDRLGPTVKRAILKPTYPIGVGSEEDATMATTNLLKVLLDISRIAKENDVEMLVVLLNERAMYVQETPEYYDEIIAFLEENNIPYVDTLAAMRDEQEKGKENRKESGRDIRRFWLPINGHYSPEGHAFIAETVLASGKMNCTN